MVENVVKSIMQKVLLTEHPHLLLPSAMKARIVSALDLGEQYEYTVRIFDKNGGVDEQFPEIPGVYSRVHYKVGTTVAIMLLYGELDPYILGEVV